jgi:putative transposase
MHASLLNMLRAHWPELGSLNVLKQPMALEALLHPTSKRPVVRYDVVSKVLGKMPTYLRRAAISHALGLEKWRWSQVVGLPLE